jgi:uncharacterized membrane protein
VSRNLPGARVLGRRVAATVRARMRNLFYGFAFLPAVIAVVLIGLAIGLVQLDRTGGAHGLDVGFGADAPTARTVLQTIATALITVAGVTFSITVVSLQLVSQQFSPRALRGFLADRINQVVAGAFVGIFAYSLLVLRAVRSDVAAQTQFVPSLSVTVAIGLAIVTLVLLLVFIHHMSTSIQLSSIAARIGRETLAGLGTLYPQRFGRPAAADRAQLVSEWHADGSPCLVYPERPGFVQSVTLDDLPAEITGEPVRIHVPVMPGSFISPGEPIAEVWAHDPGRLERALRAAVVIGNERELAQDTGYGLRQLADIAIRALSPGVNDPTTATTSIRYAGAVLAALSGRAFPDDVRRYPDGSMVAVARPQFAHFVDVAITQPGRYATDPRVARVLLEQAALSAHSAARCGADDRTRAVIAAARRVAETAGRAAGARADADSIREALAALPDLPPDRSGG